MEKIDGFKRRKEQSRENILVATKTLIEKYGVKKVSIRDVARQADVSPVTIYNLFGSKDNLFNVALESIANYSFERFGEILKTNKPSVEIMEDIFRFFLEVNESYPGFNDVETLNSPHIKELSNSILIKDADLFVEFVQKGKKEGYLNPNLSDEAIRIYFELIMKGFQADTELHSRIHKDTRLLHDLLMIVFYGFAK